MPASSRMSTISSSPREPQPPFVPVPTRWSAVYDTVFSPGGMSWGNVTGPGSREDAVPDAGAGLLWQTLEVMQAVTVGDPVDQELALDVYQRLASGEYHITSSRPGAHISERIGAAGHEREVGAYLAQHLGGTAQQRPPGSSGLSGADPHRTSGMSSSSNTYDSLENADVHLENGSDYDSDDGCSAVHFFPILLVPEVDKVLRETNSWQFNAFKLKEATSDSPLSTLAFFLLQTGGLVREFDLDGPRLAHYLRTVEAGYCTQSEILYHSRTHAADVLQSTHVLMTVGGLSKLLATGEGQGVSAQLLTLAIYLAATVHDFHHMGLSNDFLIRTGHSLALTYNDCSPNENHHVSSAFALLRQPENNFLRRMSKKNVATLRKLVIDLVLATDMKQHVGVHTKLQTRVAVCQAAERAPDQLRRCCGSFQRSFKERLQPRTPHTLSNLHMAGPNPHQGEINDADRLLLLQGGLKIADIGHLAASWPVHREWVERLEEEQFRQGDKEKQLHLSVSPLMDRDRPGITKLQPGFFDFIALPLLRTWVAICPAAQPILTAAEDNRMLWAQLGPSIQEASEAEAKAVVAEGLHGRDPDAAPAALDKGSSGWGALQRASSSGSPVFQEALEDEPAPDEQPTVATLVLAATVTSPG